MTIPTAHVIPLPRPISTNALYANAHGRIKTPEYKAWLWEATIAMRQNRKALPKFTVPVRLFIRIGEQGVSPAFDGDNAMKAYLDALVSHEVIVNDNRSWVRSGGWEWVPGNTSCVTIWDANMGALGVIEAEGVVT